MILQKQIQIYYPQSPPYNKAREELDAEEEEAEEAEDEDSLFFEEEVPVVRLLPLEDELWVEDERVEDVSFDWRDSKRRNQGTPRPIRAAHR